MKKTMSPQSLSAEPRFAAKADVAKRIARITLLVGCLILPSMTARAESTLDEAIDAVAPGIRKWATVCLVNESTGGKTVFEWIDYRDTGTKTDFWPASTVKLFTAVAACELLNARNLDLDTTATFEHEELGQWRTDCARTVREMISEIFRRSSNEDYTLLLRLCGIDSLNTDFLTSERGFPATALMRGYTAEQPWRYSQRERQRITLHSEAKAPVQVIQHLWSGRDYGAERGITVLFAENGNLTSPRVLCDCLRRVLFHEVLPASDRFRISSGQALFLKEGSPGGFHGLETKVGEKGPDAWQRAWAEVFPKARHFQKSGLISTYALDLCCIDDRANGGPCFLLCAALNAGHATKPVDGEQLVSQLTRAIALWVRKQ
jgi:hypothetical protein